MILTLITKNLDMYGDFVISTRCTSSTIEIDRTQIRPIHIVSNSANTFDHNSFVNPILILKTLNYPDMFKGLCSALPDDDIREIHLEAIHTINDDHNLDYEWFEYSLFYSRINGIVEERLNGSRITKNHDQLYITNLTNEIKSYIKSILVYDFQMISHVQQLFKSLPDSNQCILHMKRFVSNFTMEVTDIHVNINGDLIVSCNENPINIIDCDEKIQSLIALSILTYLALYKSQVIFINNIDECSLSLEDIDLFLSKINDSTVIFGFPIQLFCSLTNLKFAALSNCNDKLYNNPYQNLHLENTTDGLLWHYINEFKL